MVSLGVLYRDLAPLVSNFPSPFNKQTACKSLTFYFLAVLKRFPAFEDFKTSTKCTALEVIENENKDCIFYDLENFTFGPFVTKAYDASTAKTLAIYSFIKNHLHLPSEFAPSEYDRFQTVTNIEHVIYISCKSWNHEAYIQAQKKYAEGRICLSVDDFVVIRPQTSTVDLSICTHVIPSEFFQQNVKQVGKMVIAQHIIRCLGSKADDSGKMHLAQTETWKRLESPSERELIEKEKKEKMIEWPRQMSVVLTKEDQKLFRDKWKTQHPYFSHCRYQSMTIPRFNTTEYPLISEESLERMPAAIVELHSCYSSSVPVTNLPTSCSDSSKWLKKTLNELYECFRENKYETAAFSLGEYFTLPEALKLCCDPPLPLPFYSHEDKETKRQDVPLLKFAHTVKPYLTFLQYNPYYHPDKLSQVRINNGLYILSCTRLWFLIPPPKTSGTSAQSVTTRKKKGNSKSKNPSSSSSGVSKKDIKLGYYCITVGLNEQYGGDRIRDKLKSEENSKTVILGNGPAAMYEKVGDMKASSYAQFEPFSKFHDGPITQHLVIKSQKSIQQYFELLSKLSGLAMEMIFDVKLAQTAYDKKVVTSTPLESGGAFAMSFSQ